MDAAAIKAGGAAAGIGQMVGGIQSGLGLAAGAFGGKGTGTGTTKSKSLSGTTVGSSKMEGIFGSTK
jgi:hypothetical protein